MRTKLDEIADAFFDMHGPPSVWDSAVLHGVVRAALDHAFRHGVEQTFGFWGSTEYGGKVQPAPAEEKTYYDGVEYKGIKVPWDNRRKGERRKKIAKIAHTHMGVGLYWVSDNPYEGGKPNRRTGVERRKKP